MNIYAVINMDIVGSRKIKDRLNFQEKLKNYIHIINENHKDILPAPITMTLGDEWQFITNKPYECYNLIHEFQKLLWLDDIKTYAGIGIGTINTKIYDDIRIMDGPCFVHARQAIEIAKCGKKSTLNNITSKNNRVYIKCVPDVINNFLYNKLKSSTSFQEVAVDSINSESTLDQTIELIINSLIENTEILKERMTKKQKETYLNYLKYGSYRKLVEATGDNETISSVSQKLNSAEFFTIIKNQQIIRTLLKYHLRRGV